MTIPPLMQVRTFAPKTAVVAAGWWKVAGKTCVAAYQPKGAASYAAGLTNVANPGTYDAVEGVTAAWNTTDGWGFSGTEYLKTGYVPTALNTISFLVRFAGCTSDSGIVQYLMACDMHTSDPGWVIGLSPRPYSPGHYYANGNFSGGKSPSLTAGIMGVAGLAAFLDGAADDTISSNANTPNSGRDLWIGGRNGNTSLDGLQFPLLAGTIQAVAIYSDTLTAGEIATVSSAMSAL